MTIHIRLVVLAVVAVLLALVAMGITAPRAEAGPIVITSVCDGGTECGGSGCVGAQCSGSCTIFNQGETQWFGGWLWIAGHASDYRTCWSNGYWYYHDAVNGGHIPGAYAD